MKNKVVRYSLILTALILAPVFASDYNNELVKMDLDQTSDGAVKVNIYTNKPYNEQIIVNKKPDNKYVILLPETTNAMNVKPDISGISNVKDVDVKTQQYSSLPGKGYTKITIDSKKPIEVIPKAFVTKPLQTKTSRGNRPSVSAQQVQMALPQRVLNQQRPITNSDFVPSYERQRRANQQNYVAIPQQTVTRREAPQQSVQREPQRVIQYASQPVQQVQQAVQPVEQQTQQSQVTNVTDNSALTQNEQVALEDNSNQAVDDVNQQQIVGDDDISEDELAFFKKIIKFKQKVVKKIKSLLSVRISFSSIITVLQFILLVVLIKIIGDLVKRIQYPTETPSVTRRLIHDNDETFEQAYPSYSNMDVYNTNRSNFEEDNKEGFNVAPLSTPLNYKSKVNNSSIGGNNYRTTQAYPARNDFYRPLNEINEEDKMSIFDENSQDIERAIFKNPLTQISKQDEETLFDEVEPAEENTPFAEENYAINENQDFFNYGQNSGKDEDFFIFEDDEEDEEDVDYQEDYVDEDDQDYDEYDEDEEEYDDSEYEEEYDEDLDDEEVAEDAPQQQAPVDPFEHLSVQAKYVIDSNRGFAQVNVDGINALIGYVGSKISVIRKFKEDIKDSMQVRLNEQPDAETMIYIIKLGNYKTLVEVKPNSIRQLLDL